MNRAKISTCVALVLLGLTATPDWAAETPSNNSPLTVIVMDPLAAPLACDCVQGYAQRKYEELGKYLEKQLSCKVGVFWSESLETALRDSDGRADLIIGKHSVVLSDAKEVKIQVEPIAQLTDMEGATTQTGLFVVRAQDPALTVSDLRDYRIFFGPPECDEKHAAPMALLRSVELDIPSPVETCNACSSAATKLVELDPNIKAAAVISSYAKPLLEGCGTVKRGDLRVIGISEAVPFISAFTNNSLSKDRVKQIRSALLGLANEPKMLTALETEAGFLKVDAKLVKKKS
jgi:ABC-type phosphate/phosphonate transport system substrate-binding protein